MTISATTATLIAALIGVFGAVVGLVVERALRHTGRLVCHPVGWNLTFETEDEVTGERWWGGPEIAVRALHADYTCNVDLYNEKEVPTGLGAVTIVFVCDGGRVTDHPLEFVPHAPLRTPGC
jgi:hypothetical protein